MNNLSEQTVDQWQAKATYKFDAENKLLAGLGFTKTKDRRASRNNQHDDWGGVGSQGQYANVTVNSTSLGGLFSQIPGSSDSRLHPTFWFADFDSFRNQSIKVLTTTGHNGKVYSQAEAEAYFPDGPRLHARQRLADQRKVTGSLRPVGSRLRHRAANERVAGPSL